MESTSLCTARICFLAFETKPGGSIACSVTPPITLILAPATRVHTADARQAHPHEMRLSGIDRPMPAGDTAAGVGG